MLLSRKIAVLLLVLFSLLIPSITLAEETASKLNWTKGPTQVTLGKDLAALKVPEKYAFLNQDDTKKFLEMTHNKVSGSEIGTLMSTEKNNNWFILFRYFESGYVKDNDKEIDAGDLLQRYKEGAAKNNKDSKDPVQVLGWDISPHYDENTHNLTWSLLLEDSQGKFVNYDTRLLSRHGYVAVTLVADQTIVNQIKPQLDEVLRNFKFNSGQRYEDFDPAKDKIAEYGLAGLLAGGLGLGVAAKLGLFAKILLFFKKFWYLVGLAIVGVVKIIKSRRKGKHENDESTPSTTMET